MSDELSPEGSLRAPLLPLRDIIVFPSMVVPLFVGRQKSIQSLKRAMDGDKQIVLCAQRVATTNEPSAEDIFDVGTLGTIKQLIQLPDGTVKVLVMGQSRVRIDALEVEDDSFVVDITILDSSTKDQSVLGAQLKQVRETFATYVKLNRRIPPEILNQIAKIEDVSRLADTIVAQLSLKLDAKQDILETADVGERLGKIVALMQKEIEILQVERKIRSRVKKQMEKTQKDQYFEDGSENQNKPEVNEFKNEIEELEAKISSKEMIEEAHEKLKRALKKLKMMSPMSAEATVVRNYIDWVTSLPWKEVTQDELSLDKAQGILDRDHYGLDKPKDRIIEYLAVRSLIDKPRGPILCLVGPPGVGKTSLGKSIAESLGRKFVRLSLGGVRDEAEIRGHRRTYIGAMPGKIIQSIRKAKSNNPVFLLDEIDKMSSDFRGDPSSAMLEVLDPEQNTTFNDHYLDMDYDLSDVMFICTANDLSTIPGPLRDRMEIIRLPGYTDEEKLQIAQDYLVSKQLDANGLKGADVTFTSGALRSIVEGYTREAGVRNLEREIGTVCRKIVREAVRTEHGVAELSRKVRAKDVDDFLGSPYFSHTKTDDEDQIGLTNGLAWTQMGGVLLQNEVAVMPGQGKLTITGKLGDVMQESAQAAMSYVRARAVNLGLTVNFHKKVDVHIHFPEGALPKDGPSAGITIATSITSCLTHIPVRHDVAMTGEITLRGRVLPIGGLKEKVLAAHRAGIKKVLLPKANEKDIKDIPKNIRKEIELVPVSHMDEVLLHALALEHRDLFEERLGRPALPPDILANDEPLQELEQEGDAVLSATSHTR